MSGVFQPEAFSERGFVFRGVFRLQVDAVVDRDDPGWVKPILLDVVPPYLFGNGLDLAEIMAHPAIRSCVLWLAIKTHVAAARDEDGAAAQLCDGSRPEIGGLMEGVSDLNAVAANEAAQAARYFDCLPVVSSAQREHVERTGDRAAKAETLIDFEGDEQGRVAIARKAVDGAEKGFFGASEFAKLVDDEKDGDRARPSRIRNLRRFEHTATNGHGVGGFVLQTGLMQRIGQTGYGDLGGRPRPALDLFPIFRSTGARTGVKGTGVRAPG